MRENWRLLPWRMADGATNMAVDEAILREVGAGSSPPTVRLFGWWPPCVSLGYAQRALEELDVEACERFGYTWLRRPTGGRAILHRDEVTYSVAMPLTEPRSWGGILGSYQRISRGLVMALESLGASVDRAEPGPLPSGLSSACFDQPSGYEITHLGRKLVGSAQVRRRNGMLQHGALPLRGAPDAIVEVLRLSVAARTELCQRLRQRATTLEDVIGRPVSYEEVVAAYVEGLSEALEVNLVPGELTAAEKTWADTVGTTKYGPGSWNIEGRFSATEHGAAG